MKHIENFKNNVLNEGLNYCKSCSSLSESNLCKYCKVLEIIGIKKEDDSDNIYGTLKYYDRFNKLDKIYDYINQLNYNLTQFQKDEIIKLFNKK